MVFVENKEICGKCGGRCCKNNPGIYKGGEVEPSLTDIGRKYVIVADIIMNPALIKNFISGDSEHNVDELVKASKKAWDIMSENALISGSYFCAYMLALRPIGKNDRAGLNGTMFFPDGKIRGNMCSMLTKTGCTLSLNERPYECKALIPSQDFKCSGNNNICGIMSHELIVSWVPLQGKMRKILREYLIGLNAKQVMNLMNSKDELFQSMIEEGFMGMYIDMDGKVKFSDGYSGITH